MVVPPVDRSALLSLVADLVRIDSVNPDLDPAGPGEGEIAAFVAAWLERAGLEVAVHAAAPGRPSVVGRLPGRGGGRSLLLNAHLDTVGVEGMAEPFSGALRGGRLYGRGAYDMKGSLGAAMMAAAALAAAGERLAGDLYVAAVADEEVASLGTADLIPRYPVDGAIVTEPTHLRLCLAHKGFVWIEVEVLGRAAHGSRFTEGVDANLRLGRFLAALDGLEAELRQRPGHPLTGPPSLHVGTLRGGTAFSVYAARSAAGIERRTLPGETEAAAVAEIQALLDRLRAEDPGFQASLRTVLARPPFAAAAGSAVARAVAEAGAEVLGAEPERVGEAPWMDAALHAAAGTDTVVFGPAGAGAHADEEWVDADSVVRCCEVLIRAAMRYCG